MPLTAEWRTSYSGETVVIVDDGNVVCALFPADPPMLSKLLTSMGGLETWIGQEPQGAGRPAESWGDLVISRAGTGEVISIDPELFWDRIYRLYRSRGVDFDSDRWTVQ